MMAARTDFDPHRHWRALAWRNRVAIWRRQPGEPLFHAASVLALVALLAWVAGSGLSRLQSPAQQLLARWPWIVGSALLVLFALRQRRALGALLAARRSDWLAAQPIEARFERRARWRTLGLEAALQLLAGLGLLSLLALPLQAWLGYLVLVSLAALAAATHQGPRAARAGPDATRRRPRGEGRGRVWRWQWIEAGAARFGPSLAPGAFALLLLPMGSSILAMLVLLASGLLVAALLTAWRRSLGVIPAAQAWLAPQPLQGRDVLREASPLPLAVLVLAASLLLGVGIAFGQAGLGAGLALGTLGLGLVQLLCLLAERSRPRRATAMSTALAVLLLGSLQALPPLAPALWLGLVLRLLRRILRT